MLIMEGSHKNSSTFQDPQNIVPGLCRSPAMFKYTDKQQLLCIYKTCITSCKQTLLAYTGFIQKYDSGFPDLSTTISLLFHFSRHFVHPYVNKNITKLAFKRRHFLHNVFFYSKYQMGFKFLNFELEMLCVMNCKKNNKCMGYQQCNSICIFQVSITVFKDQSGCMIIFKAFEALKIYN